jgi:hypothetical protein
MIGCIANCYKFYLFNKLIMVYLAFLFEYLSSIHCAPLIADSLKKE